MRHFVSSVAFVAVLMVMIITTKAAGKDQPSSPASEGHDKAAVASKVITNSIGMKMVLVPAGEFMMGSPDSDQDADSAEKPRAPGADHEAILPVHVSGDAGAVRAGDGEESELLLQVW